jgi:hypothetical protein
MKMFNPFAPLSNPLLLAFVRAGKKYFVRQTFHRGDDDFEGTKGSFIITHYAEAGHAEHHLGAISEDQNRFLYEWENAEHQKKLILASNQPAGYKIYSSVFVKNWQAHISNPVKQRLRNYIQMKLGWSASRGERLSFDIYANYGELYAQLKLGSEEVRIKLEDIENLT